MIDYLQEYVWFEIYALGGRWGQMRERWIDGGTQKLVTSGGWEFAKISLGDVGSALLHPSTGFFQSFHHF